MKHEFRSPVMLHASCFWHLPGAWRAARSGAAKAAAGAAAAVAAAGATAGARAAEAAGPAAGPAAAHARLLRRRHLAGQHRPARERDLAGGVDVGDHDVDLVAQVDLVLNALDAMIGQLGDVDQ